MIILNRNSAGHYKLLEILYRNGPICSRQILDKRDLFVNFITSILNIEKL